MAFEESHAYATGLLTPRKLREHWLWSQLDWGANPAYSSVTSDKAPHPFKKGIWYLPYRVWGGGEGLMLVRGPHSAWEWSCHGYQRASPRPVVTTQAALYPQDGENSPASLFLSSCSLPGHIASKNLSSAGICREKVSFFDETAMR